MHTSLLLFYRIVFPPPEQSKLCVSAACFWGFSFFPYLAFKHRALAARLLQLRPSSVVAITKGERTRFDGAAALSTLPL